MCEVSSNNGMYYIQCENSEQRNPVDFVFAIDNSGSMDESAGIAGDIETQCYSRLDLVKHAAVCIIESLGPKDKLGIVVYSSSARVLQSRCYMTDANKQNAMNYIKNIVTEGATNLWDGLQTSLSISSPQSSVLLFTDGQPTAGNQQVDIAFRNYLQRNKFTQHVYTFGFSNEVNSKLLNEISTIGNGQFHFISDSAMLFTVIVNFLANYYTMYGDIYVNNVNHGQLYYGQNKYIMAEPNSIVNIVNVFGTNHNVQSTSVSTSNIGIILNNTINVLYEIIQDLSTRNFTRAKNTLDNFVNLNNSNTESIVQDLIENICDKMFLAITEAHYTKWGKHYIYSFINALKNQINNNFKDKFVQNFGGTMFYKLQDDLNTLVANVPPPPPSRTYRGQTYTVSSMSSFNNRSNPCFSGHNKVTMADNSFKYVKDIVAGDKVYTPNGTVTVKLVVKTCCRHNLTDLCKIGTLVVTLAPNQIRRRMGISKRSV